MAPRKKTDGHRGRDGHNGHDGIDPRWKAVGRKIAADREAKGIGQAELGRLIGLQTPTSIWRYEAGHAAIPIARLEQIAEKLGTRPERYIPVKQTPARPPITPAELRDVHHRLARAALEAAVHGTPEAIEALQEVIAEHHQRTGR